MIMKNTNKKVYPFIFTFFFTISLPISFSNPNPNDLNYVVELSQINFFSFPILAALGSHKPTHSFDVNNGFFDNSRENKKANCNGFPKEFPPKNTNTTSYYCVDLNGCCNFTTVQRAVDAVGNNSVKRNIIWINTGIYYEKVLIPKTKPNITFEGQGYDKTAIAWNDTAHTTNGTYFSATVNVFAPNFIAKNISFMNLAPIPKLKQVGGQGVAMRISGDKAAFLSCGFFGAQDTLLDDEGRHYFKDCYIQGSVDFIFGNGRSMYKNCRVISVANSIDPGTNEVKGAITAQARTSSAENTGFSFVDCTVGGSGRVWLGRAWRPSARVVFAFSNMTDVVAPQGWNDYNNVSDHKTVLFGEYKCGGPGSNLTMRPAYIHKLDYSQVAPFLNYSFIDGPHWLPFT